MSLDAAFWVDVAWKGLSVVWIGFYLPLLRMQDRVNKRLDAVEKDHAALAKTLAKLETEVAALPGDHAIEQLYKLVNKEVGALHEKVNSVRKDVSTMEGGIAEINANVRILLNKAIQGNPHP